MNNNTLNIDFHKSFEQSENIINTCKNISSICNEKDILNNSFFVDTEYDNFSDFPWLYYASHNSEIIGFISIYIIDSYNIEICGFVLPKYRRNKIATELFSMMVMDFNSKSFVLSMNTDNKIGKKFVHQMGFEYRSTECSMKLLKQDYKTFHNVLSLAPEKQGEEIVITGLLDGKEIGRSVTSVFHNTVCIHDVEIFERYRRKGYGYRLIGTLLNHIFEKYDTAVLHVTKENIPAYNLYQKLGFKTIEELEYYEL